MTSEPLSLSEMLRSRREHLTPADVGLESFGLRRTAGLRREELAQLAGVSVDYIMRLEQGRARTPSQQVVASLARALQLSRTETALLHRAAGLTPPGSGTVSHHIPAGVQRMLARMSDLPRPTTATIPAFGRSSPTCERAAPGSPRYGTRGGQPLIRAW
jgi:transcriptional regulator with XRE-family HTH domain